MNINELLDSIENKIQAIQNKLNINLLSVHEQQKLSSKSPPLLKNQSTIFQTIFGTIYTYNPLELSKIQTNKSKYNFLEDEYTKVKNIMEWLIFKDIISGETKLDDYRKSIINNGTINEECILITHQKMRFLELELLLLNNPNVNVYLPGENDGKYHHFAQGKDSIGCSTFKDTELQSKMITQLNYLVAYLMKKYPDRVHLGNVPYNDASHTKICVFTANASNWNERNGKNLTNWSGQAKAAKSHRVGIFGISTMPDFNKSLLGEPLIRHFT
jgi:hypothetical protein